MPFLALLRDAWRHRHAWAAYRWVARRASRYGPTVILFVFAAPVVFTIGFALFWSDAHGWLDKKAKRYDVGVSLIEHVAVAAAVVAAAYYSLFGYKRQKALKRYRRLARTEPWQVVDWALGNPPKVRPVMTRLVADGIARSSDPAVVVVRGRAGTGRTSFIVWLAARLAEKKFIPVPVLVGRDGKFDLELVKDSFKQGIDDVLDTEEEADAIWHRAKATREIVVLVDGLDDEIVAGMWRDGGDELCRTIKSLRSKNIAIVLATTRELPLSKIRGLQHEDLDLLNREEAERFIEDEIRRTAEKSEEQAAVQARIDEAIDAVKRLPDLVGDSFIAPYYLDVLLRLQENDVSLGDLPRHTDLWRAAVLGKYLDAVENGKIVRGTNFAEGEDADEVRKRGRDAKRAAEAVAGCLAHAQTDDLMVARESLTKVGERALSDARALNLLWVGSQRVGFASDDLGAYLAAERPRKPAQLHKDLARVGREQGSSTRRDRHVLISLIFWHILHGRQKRVADFRELLQVCSSCKRPSVVAAVVRIAASCDLTTFDARVEKLVEQCIASFAHDGAPTKPSPHARELLGVVRALAGWQGGAAHRRLWQLATSLNVEVEWPAAKALALAPDNPEVTLLGAIEQVLDQVNGHRDWDELSHPTHKLGNALASLAWILPALREGNGVEEQLRRVEELCRDGRMSPLRGEMSLAQGLKLALVNGKASKANLEHVRRLQRDQLQHPDEGLKFWHARLALVQAMLADGWRRGNGDRDVDALRDELRTLRKGEKNVLVKHGIDLARDGLKELKRSTRRKEPQPPLTKYMWTHERDVVWWVEQGRHKVSQLAGDVVLLSNMIYRLRRQDPEPRKADGEARKPELPKCILETRRRERIKLDCDCGRGLCKSGHSPVLLDRAPFSPSFCREQARVVAQHGPPPWTKPKWVPKRRSRDLRSFWNGQAEVARPKPR